MMDESATTSPFAVPLPPGPSWSVPRISVPSCLGVLPEYQIEWWYYAGHAFDTEDRGYSLQFTIVRAALGSPSLDRQLIACTTGIGRAADNKYLWHAGYGLGVSQDAMMPKALTILPVTDGVYDVKFESLLAPSRAHVVRTGGAATGAVGSEYRLKWGGIGLSGAFEADLELVDERGMIMEWQSAYIGPAGDSGPGSSTQFSGSSYEYAQPRLGIKSGKLIIDLAEHTIARGSLWLDRQVVTYPPPHDESSDGDDLEAMMAKSMHRQLYRGSWFGITLDNGIIMALSCFWQQPPPDRHPPLLQWQTGTLLGLPPVRTYGNIYLPVPEDARRMRNGGAYLRGLEKDDPNPNEFDFDVNILIPQDPDTSPHWKSPKSGITYSSGWMIRFGPEAQRHGVPPALYLRVLVSGCENLLPDKNNAFWEGAALVTDEAGNRLGYAFAEQMGFN